MPRSRVKGSRVTRDQSIAMAEPSQHSTTQDNQSKEAVGILKRIGLDDGFIENHIIKTLRNMLREIGADENDPRAKALTRLDTKQRVSHTKEI